MVKIVRLALIAASAIAFLASAQAAVSAHHATILTFTRLELCTGT